MSRLVKIYDTTLRDGTQGEGITFSVAGQAPDRPAAGRPRRRLHRGRLARLQPEGHARSSARSRTLHLKHARVAAFGATRRAGIKAEDDPSLQALVDARTPVVTIVGKTLALPRHATSWAPRCDENLAMIADSVAFLRPARSRRSSTTPSTSSTASSATASTRCGRWRRPRAPAPGAWCCATPTAGRLPHEVAEIVREVQPAVRRPAGHPRPQRRRSCAVANSLAAVLEGADAGAGDRQRLRRAVRQREPDLHHPQPRAQAGHPGHPRPRTCASCAKSRATSPSWPTCTPWQHQPFVGDSAFAHKAGMHVSAVLKHPETYEHIDPGAGGQPAARAGLRAGREVQRPVEGPGVRARPGARIRRRPAGSWRR